MASDKSAQIAVVEKNRCYLKSIKSPPFNVYTNVGAVQGRIGVRSGVRVLWGEGDDGIDGDGDGGSGDEAITYDEVIFANLNYWIRSN